MKNQIHHAPALVCWVLLACIPGSALAQAGRLYSSGCRQDSCWESFVLGQTQISQQQMGGLPRQLYAVEIQTIHTTSGTATSTEWVQCSTLEPFVGFRASGAEDVIYLHYINPGGEVFGYNASSHELYWAVCHNQWDGDVWQPEAGLEQLAKQLGYSTQLNSDQKTVPASLFQTR